MHFPHTVYDEIKPNTVVMKFGVSFLSMKKVGKSLEFRTQKKAEASNQDNIKRVGNKRNIKCKNLKK